MDAAGDQDLKLRKSSPELIAELRRSLPQFLWKSKKAENGSDSKITGRVRRLVRKAKTDQLIKLVGPSVLLSVRLWTDLPSPRSWSPSKNGLNCSIPISATFSSPWSLPSSSIFVITSIYTIASLSAVHLKMSFHCPGPYARSCTFSAKSGAKK